MKAVNMSRITIILDVFMVVMVSMVAADGNIDNTIMPCVRPMVDCDPHYTELYKQDNGDKIIGGEVAEPGSTPWLVSLQDTQYPEPIHFCGGSLLNHYWVITAASCINNYRAPYEAVQIVLGEYDLQSDEGWEKTRGIGYVIQHPKYDFYTHDNDVALILMSYIVLYNDRIQPISLLPLENHGPRPMKGGGFLANCENIDWDLLRRRPDGKEDKFVISGWGRTSETSAMSPVIRVAKVPMVSAGDCASAYPEINHSNICVGNLTYGGLGPCQGDWGGPLVSEHKFIAGVSSWTNRCGEPGMPAIYTDILVLIEWICSVIT